LSIDGKVQERVEVARRSVSEAQLRRVNQRLAADRFMPMTSLELPFSAYDLNLMHLHVSGVVIHYVGEGLLVDRDETISSPEGPGHHRLATLELPTSEICPKAQIRSLFLDDKTHTLAAELQFEGVDCTDPPPRWWVLRYP
jgi:hypothetical protein